MTEGMVVKNGQDRFGVPNLNLVAARKWKEKKKNRHYPFHCYVPTRNEVATLQAEQLRPILVGWMCHSPTEIIPSRTQIGEVCGTLLSRNDKDELNDLIEMCKHYIRYS